MLSSADQTESRHIDYPVSGVAAWRGEPSVASPNATPTRKRTVIVAERTSVRARALAHATSTSRARYTRYTYSKPLVVENLLDGDPVIHVGSEHFLYEILRRLANAIPERRLHLQIQLNRRISRRANARAGGRAWPVRARAARAVDTAPTFEGADTKDLSHPLDRHARARIADPATIVTCTRPRQIASRSLSREPTNGSVPVSRTCSSTPADQMSPGFPYCRRWITSGAMKCGHPTRPARPRASWARDRGGVGEGEGALGEGDKRWSWCDQR